MSLTGEGRRGWPLPPGPQGGAERKRKPPGPLPASWGRGCPMAWGLPSLPGQGPHLGRGISMRGKGQVEGAGVTGGPGPPGSGTQR